MLKAPSGAVAIVGNPNWVRDDEMVFNGMEAKLRAPPTKPCTWLKGPPDMADDAGAAAAPLVAVVAVAAVAPADLLAFMF